jgi:hypothetical protein
VRKLPEERTHAAITDDLIMLDSVAGEFADVERINSRLAENGVPYEEEFDSFALRKRVHGSSPEGTFAIRILPANNLLERHYGQRWVAVHRDHPPHFST